MAQRIGYFEDNVTFTEGPFVMVNAGGWRIEASNGQEAGCNAVMPDLSIYRLAKDWGYEGKRSNPALMEPIVDRLNEWVREGKIVQRDTGGWYYPPFAYGRMPGDVRADA
jgi:hypothetical protein